VAGSCGYGDKPSSSGATDLVSYIGIRLEGLSKTTETFSQVSGPTFEPGTSRIRSRGVKPLDHDVRWQYIAGDVKRTQACLCLLM
jgi:hypothetical protein